MGKNRRELLKKVLDQENVRYIPVGFWWHYLTIGEQFTAVDNDDFIHRVIEGHKKTFDEFKPDFVKVMSDGFFADPSICKGEVASLDDLRIQPLSEDDPWIVKQIKMVKEITDYYKGQVMTFYNVFSPLNVIRIYMEHHGDHGKDFVKMVMDNPEKIHEVAMSIAKNQDIFLEKLKQNVSIDGIYYSVQNIQSKTADWDFHKKYVMPSDMYLLDRINAKWEYNILHICGDGHFPSDIHYYKDYRAKAYNWAVNADKVSLKEGKDFFGKTVIGGFDNASTSLLYKGSNQELRNEVKKIIEETEGEGLIIGADCTISSDIDIKRLKYIRQVSNDFIVEKEE